MILNQFHTGVEFRQDHSGNPHLISLHKRLRVVGDQQFNQFRLDSLHADIDQVRSHTADRAAGILLDPKAQLGREADRP